MKELFKDLGEIKERYNNGENIVQFISENYKDLSKIEAIMVSYDLQAGSYTKHFDTTPEQKVKYCEELAKKLDALGPLDSFLNVGVGEAIILANLISRLNSHPKHIFGFDISWSRIDFAKKFISRFDVNNVTLTTGDLFHSPFMDNSIELVMSNHSLEPNGGREEEALKELYRISSKYVVINEPCYEWATDEGKKRIETHGYVKNLHKVAERLGYEIVSHEKFENPVAVLNPTSCLIIKKNDVGDYEPNKLACPITKFPIVPKNDCYFSPKSLLAYPIIKGIPCLNSDNAVLTSSYV